jgi:ferrochelatase
MNEKTAIILLNLGGPDSKDSIKPFLMNFFLDKNIIRLPYPLRWVIAKMISIRRSKREAGDSYGFLGDKSPLLENSEKQSHALQALLDEQAAGVFKTFICMRYWHPMADEVAKRVKEWSATRVVLLPLYPQYSTTTTRSSYQEWEKAAKKIGLEAKSSLVCCYPKDNGFITASAENVRVQYDLAVTETGLRPRILFSAHGLPEDIVTDGDPYQWQCEETAKDIVAATGIKNPDWLVCYQSRVGPKKWLGPSTESTIVQAAEDGVPVVILPHAFTQEHVETLVELDIEYRHIAQAKGIKGYYRAQTVGTHPQYINSLANIVYGHLGQDKTIASNTGARLCPGHCVRCAMEQYGHKNIGC